MHIFKSCMSFEMLQFAKLLPSYPWCRYHELQSPWAPSPSLACAGRQGKSSRAPVASRSVRARAHQGNWQLQLPRIAPFSNMCSIQADNNSRKLRLPVSLVCLRSKGRWLDYSRDTRKPEHSAGLGYRACSL
jgi:hypothetical protein